VKSYESLTLAAMMLAALSACSGSQQSRSEKRAEAIDHSVGRSNGAEAYQADNAGRNERDTERDTVVPADQAKSSDRDVEITRMIRERLTSSDDFSVNAKNIKIITLNGLTTLRGPVKSMNERAKILTIARQIAGRNAVRNELEILRD